MLVVVEYISKIKIEGTEVPVYVTDDSRMFVGMEIMPYTSTICEKQHAFIPVEKQVLTPENEFALTLKKMLSPKKKK